MSMLPSRGFLSLSLQRQKHSWADSASRKSKFKWKSRHSETLCGSTITAKRICEHCSSVLSAGFGVPGKRSLAGVTVWRLSRALGANWEPFPEEVVCRRQASEKSTDFWEVSGAASLGNWMQLQNNPVCNKVWGLGGCSVKDFPLPAALKISWRPEQWESVRVLWRVYLWCLPFQKSVEWGSYGQGAITDTRQTNTNTVSFRFERSLTLFVLFSFY